MSDGPADNSAIEALRLKYGTAQGGQIFDSDFARVAARVFTGTDRRKWPFAGPPTFLDMPYIADPLERPLAEIDVALVGVPMDLGVTNRPGARFGPRAVRNVERIGPYDHVLRVAPLELVRVADIGDVPMRSRFDLAQCHHDIELFYAKLKRAGIIPLSVGGDHSVSLPILKGLAEGGPVGLIHIDAHCDTSGPYEGAKFHHGGPFRQAVLSGVLDPRRTVQIGIRGASEYLWEFSYESGMTVIHADEIDQMGIPMVIKRAREVVGGDPVYVSFDVDSLDPAFAPGTGTPEVGGLTPREALAILRGLSGINMIGGDVVEVAPQYDGSSVTAQCAAQILFTLLCLTATNIRNKATK